MLKQFTVLLQKGTLQLLVISMIVGLLTPINNVSALEEQTQQETPNKTEVIILGEDESLREESSKTFILSDKTRQKIIYSVPVHYDDNGEWKEIDNTFVDDGLTYEEDSIVISEVSNLQIEETINNESEIDEIIDSEHTSEFTSGEVTLQDTSPSNDDSTIISNPEIDSIEQFTENIETSEEETLENTETENTESSNNNDVELSANTDDSQVLGYKNKNGKLNIKFSKKVHSKNMVSIADGNYKVTWGFVDYKNKSLGEFSKISAFYNPIESAYNNIAQQINYSNVIEGIDLVYQIDSLQIKENIIINKPTKINEFTFEYKVNKLELFLNDNGEIEAKNEAGDIIFLMPKPYMYDSNGLYSDNVHYEISQKNKKYSITIVADEEWMNDEERAYPIVIDPVIQSQQTSTAIDSTFIASDTDYDDTNFDGHFELLVGRESSAYNNCRSLFKFSLPTLNRGDMVVDAKFFVALYAHSFYTTSTADLQINAHMITNSWTETNVTWNSIKGSGGIDSYYDNTILDYDFIKKTDTQNVANWKVFDVTSAVKSWYNGTANNGILLKSYNESGTNTEVGVKGSFWPEDYNNSYNAFPYISISYRNNKGIESYWDYTSFSTYSAGDVYIDNYSGNLIVSHLDASTYGSRAPVNISHIYNGYMSSKNVSNVRPYVGYGWKLNIQQTLRPSSAYGLTGTSATTYPYVYMDADGTEHYFMKKDSQYLDEDGLGLELKIITNGYTITDKKDNVMTFNSSGNIAKITDTNGNTITYTYSGSTITKVTSGNTQALTLSYDSNGYLTKITDQASRVTTFTYTNNLLTKITYPDGKTTNYTYDSNSALQTMTSSDGTSVTFSYTTLASGKKVSQVVEKGSDGTQGQTLKFDRNKYNITLLTASGVDNIIGTKDDVTTELQFDSTGRLISTSAYTSEKELGASVLAYTASSPNENKSDIQQLNRITKASALSRNIDNPIINHSGETTEYWSSSAKLGDVTFTFGSTSEEALFGTKSFKLEVTSSEIKARARFYQNVSRVDAYEYYTASAYVKTENITPVDAATDYGACLVVSINASSMYDKENPDEGYDVVSEYIIGTTDENISDGWRRVSVTFMAPYDTISLEINGVIRSATGTAYFDGFQLEKGYSANPYNLLENSDFQNVNNNIPISWTGTNTTSQDKASVEQAMNDNQLYEVYSLKFGSTVGVERNYYQLLNIDGSEEDNYIISGWAYGKGMSPTNDNRKFEIAIRIKYSDGTYVWKSPLEFNTSLYGWQYGAKIFDLSDETSTTKIPTQIGIYLKSANQANSLYFDHLQLTKTKVTENKYDDEGNLTSSDGNTYVYTDGNLTSTTDEEGKTTSYVYDTHNNLISTTTNSGIVSANKYDSYGNITEETVTGGSLITKAEIVYDSTNSFQTKTIDQYGGETTYDYNTQKGLLNSFTDASGIKTSYSYNNSNQLISTTRSGISQTNGYDTTGKLSSLTSTGATYGFNYDVYGNRISTKVGNEALATYTYGNYNGDLATTVFGNGKEIEYRYDEYGNITRIYENDTFINEYIYDSLGNIFESFDYKNDIKLTYDYDPEGRLIRVTAFDLNIRKLKDKKLYSYEYCYDDHDKIIFENFIKNGYTMTKDYTYGNENEITKVTFNNFRDVTYEYDTLKRITKKQTETSMSEITNSYTYANSEKRTGYTTSRISSETINGKTYSYSYDEIGNITQITIGGWPEQTISYYYDDNSQLIREDNQQLNKTITYTYDTSGNILTKKEYSYTTSETLPTATKTINYSYTNENWKDQLTSYNGQIITYDEIGNPLTYKGSNMVWDGRDLLSITKDSDTISYTYDSNGIRKTKTVNGQTTSYDYVGNQLVHETRNDCELYYFYDASGQLTMIMLYKNNVYVDYYVSTNIRGDVEAIYNSSGISIANYTYDSWGNLESVLDIYGNEITDPSHIANLNPFRYRGYYYDTETGFYYLQTRYYDPEVGRFINADTLEILGVQANLYDKNLYAYCDNNPIVRIDVFGNLWVTIIDFGSFGISLVEVAATPGDLLAWAGLVGDLIDLVPYVTGIGEMVRTMKVTKTFIDTENVIEGAKTVKKSIGNKVGSYEILFESKYKYVGKGPFARSIQSALDHSIDKNTKKITDTVEMIRWRVAKNNTSAFIEEYALQTLLDPLKTYNKITSPGKKYYLGIGGGLR